MKLNILLLAAFLALGSMAAVAGDPARKQIEMVFDRAKGGFYAEYSRALKVNPRLAGKAVFDFDIAVSGAVTDCRVVSSELTPDLDSKLCERIRKMQFGPQKAPSTIRKPIDFFPAA